MGSIATVAGGVEPTTLPLCVDLDGTLVAGDTLYESLICALRRWDTAPKIIGWLARGRAYLKARLAGIGPIDPAVLPYNRPLLAYLRSERQRGRPIVRAVLESDWVDCSATGRASARTYWVSRAWDARARRSSGQVYAL